MTILGVADFGRPQLQYDTFDLAKLPSGSVIETAAAPQINKTPRFLQLMETTIHPDGTKPHDQRTPTTAKPNFTCVYFQNVRLLLAGTDFSGNIHSPFLNDQVFEKITP